MENFETDGMGGIKPARARVGPGDTGPTDALGYLVERAAPYSIGDAISRAVFEVSGSEGYVERWRPPWAAVGGRRLRFARAYLGAKLVVDIPGERPESDDHEDPDDDLTRVGKPQLARLGEDVLRDLCHTAGWAYVTIGGAESHEELVTKIVEAMAEREKPRRS